ncbi:MAG: OadG-related small transporter subunit [Clostridiales bacterium]|nr:OadG-related small transporter subunit [Clostridiales bacterium]
MLRLFFAAQIALPFSKEAINTAKKGLTIMGYGMVTVIGVLFLFYIIVKLLIKLFPEKGKSK